jgi:hypothetical protein
MRKLYIQGVLFGVLLEVGVIAFTYWRHPGWWPMALDNKEPVASIVPFAPPLVAIFLMLILAPIHEALHASLSHWDQVVAGISLRAAVCYVAPFGKYSKGRALLMIILPLLLLTAAPLIVATCTDNLTVYTWSYLIAGANAMGSGADVGVAIELIHLRGPVEYTAKGWKGSDVKSGPAI